MIKLNYRKIGEEGQPLIVCHGLLGMMDNWATLGKQFAGSFQVYLVDLRNHGKSPHTVDLDYPLMAEDLLHLMDDLGLDKVHLLGHSMGGKVVQNFAQSYSHRLYTSIVVDIAMRAYPHSHDHIFAAMKSLPVEELSSRREAQEILSEWIHDPSVVHFILKNLDRQDQGYAWKVNLQAIQKNYEHILAKVEPTKIVTVPTLFIKGEHSNYIKQKDFQHIKNSYSNVTIEEIKGAGHWVHAENPKDFFSVCMTFYKNQIN